jgi:hypothetical protein
MMRLPRSLAAWGSDAFPATLADEVGTLYPTEVPLHRLASTGHALDTRLSVTLIGSRETDEGIGVRLGIFFEEILPGCSCGDEPEPRPAYGELVVHIDKASALARWEPVEGWGS